MQQVNSTARLNENNFSDLGANAGASIINLWFINDLFDCGGAHGPGSLYGYGTSNGWFAMTKAVFDCSALGRVDTSKEARWRIGAAGHPPGNGADSSAQGCGRAFC